MGDGNASRIMGKVHAGMTTRFPFLTRLPLNFSPTNCRYAHSQYCLKYREYLFTVKLIAHTFVHAITERVVHVVVKNMLNPLQHIDVYVADDILKHCDKWRSCSICHYIFNYIQ